MATEQYILEITRYLHTLDEKQLCYIYTYIKGYFDINDVVIKTKTAPANT